MSVVVTSIAQGSRLEDLAFFGNMENLPYPLDSPVWDSAQYLNMRGFDNAAMRESLEFSVRLELLRAHDNAPMRESLTPSFAGHDWITRAQ